MPSDSGSAARPDRGGEPGPAAAAERERRRNPRIWIGRGAGGRRGRTVVLGAGGEVGQRQRAAGARERPARARQHARAAEITTQELETSQQEFQELQASVADTDTTRGRTLLGEGHSSCVLSSRAGPSSRRPPDRMTRAATVAHATAPCNGAVTGSTNALPCLGDAPRRPATADPPRAGRSNTPSLPAQNKRAAVVLEARARRGRVSRGSR
jgi:hypothetical protein